MKLAKLFLLLFTPKVGGKPQYIIISLLDPDLFFFYERSVRVYSFPTGWPIRCCYLHGGLVWQCSAEQPCTMLWWMISSRPACEALFMHRPSSSYGFKAHKRRSQTLVGCCCCERSHPQHPICKRTSRPTLSLFSLPPPPVCITFGQTNTNKMDSTARYDFDGGASVPRNESNRFHLLLILYNKYLNSTIRPRVLDTPTERYKLRALERPYNNIIIMHLSDYTDAQRGLLPVHQSISPLASTSKDVAAMLFYCAVLYWLYIWPFVLLPRLIWYLVWFFPPLSYR